MGLDPVTGTLIGTGVQALGGGLSGKSQANAKDAETATSGATNLNNNLISLYNAINSGETGLYNANTNATATKNAIATQNPTTFAKQVRQGDLLVKEPFVGRSGQGASYTVSDADKQAAQALQQQAITNLLKSPTDNPVPVTSTDTGAPALATTPSIVAPPNVNAATVRAPGVAGQAPTPVTQAQKLSGK